jgi:UDP-N-acetyl-D-galactosamine dehydrogenase
VAQSKDPIDTRIGIVGLGYVGLPLAVEFGKRFPTIGYDVDARRVTELQHGNDRTRETSAEELASARLLSFSTEPERLRGCNVFVVAVPTPVDEATRPNLTPLEKASATVGGVLSRGDLVIYESTVYPGTTEEVCVPVLERVSGLKLNDGFFCGYSPERISPGDKARRLTNIKKITSGSTPEVAERVDALYRTIIAAGTHKAPSIKVAEAAKVIENTQRDVNIALMNELAMILDRVGVDTTDVLEAAGTKWNFLPFRPGLVGGHCIGVDPYYLTHKATVLGYHPELILAARRINSRMGLHVAHQVIRLMAQKRILGAESRVLVLGVTFKEDCPDLRNSRVVDIVHELEAMNIEVDVFDALADRAEVEREFGFALIEEPTKGAYDAIILAVAHSHFRGITSAQLKAWGKKDFVVFDVKSVLERDLVDRRL